MHGPTDMSRRMFLRRAAAAAVVPAALGAVPLVPPRALGAAADAAAARRARYFRFCDDLMPHISRTFAPSKGYYSSGDAGETMTNANMLLVHATMAAFGQTGAARQDARARAITAALCMPPAWRGPVRALRADQTHDLGWQSTFSTGGFQHVVVDTAVVRGLAAAYHARDELRLPDATVLAIRDRLRRAAYSAFYEFPQLRLNQINWPIEIYAHAAAVLGEPHLLKHDTRLQLGRFADAITRVPPGQRVPFTGPGYHFHYLPQNSASSPANVDNAEYANLVCGVIAFYEQARRAGMQELDALQLRKMRAWVERVLCGYWTHAGYVNWDSGLGFGRWHQAKKFPLCQEALIGIAAAPRFQPTRRHGQWAAYLFDQGLDWYARQIAEAGGLPPAVFFGVATQSAHGDDRLGLARMMGNACRAVIHGLDGVTPAVPPPFYAYDPDIGRLAISTPAYNTAIMAVNQHAFPYGGMEPARFFDGEQHVVANVGGVGDACFGVVVVNHATGKATRSQTGRPVGNLAHPPVRLTRAPRGTSAHPVAYPAHAYAGPFEGEIAAVGRTTGATATITSSHRFRAGHVQSSWSVRANRKTAARHSIRAQFPSWGKAATITAVMRDGSVRPMDGSQIALRDISWFHIAGVDRGYVVVIRSPKPAGRARLLHPAKQSSSPRPGPTLALELLTRATLRRRTITVRYAPARDQADAARIAARLGGVTPHA